MSTPERQFAEAEEPTIFGLVLALDHSLYHVVLLLDDFLNLLLKLLHALADEL